MRVSSIARIADALDCTIVPPQFVPKEPDMCKYPQAVPAFPDNHATERASRELDGGFSGDEEDEELWLPEGDDFWAEEDAPLEDAQGCD